MTRKHLSKLVPLLVFLAVWLAWFSWHRLSLSIVPYEKHFPDSKTVQVRGLVKRQPDGSYKRHSLWREYHKNGQIKSEIDYADGRPRGLGRYWDESGRHLPTSHPAASGLTDL